MAVVVKNPTPNIIAALQDAKAAAAVDPWLEMAGKPYRPSSGTEGMSFDEQWCDHCTRDAEYRNGGPDTDPAIACQIIADTFAYDIGDPRYPKEWVYDRKGRPCCTAFTTDPNKPIRCDKTMDMFSAVSATQHSNLLLEATLVVDGDTAG